MHNRRQFFKGLLSLLPVAALAEIPAVVKSPHITEINSLAELWSYMTQSNIDYDMISRMINIASPGREIPPYKEPVEGVDYILTENFNRSLDHISLDEVEQKFLHS